MKRNIVLAAAASAVFASPAFAASFAGMTLGDFTVTLFDLNPDDGIAPGIVWNGDSSGLGRSFLSGQAYDTAGPDNQHYWNSGGRPWSNVSESAATALSRASASVASTAATDPTLDATLTARGSALDAPAGSYSLFNATADVEAPFTLSAGTLAVFSARAVGDAVTTAGRVPGAGTESAHGDARLQVFGTAPGNSNSFGSQSVFDYASVNAEFDSALTYNTSSGQFEVAYSGESRGASAVLTVSYLNYEDAAKDGRLYAGVFVSGQTVATPVPEPQTWALMLAGLGIVGLLAGRRSDCASRG